MYYCDSKTQHSPTELELEGKGAIFPLLVPLFGPGLGAERHEAMLEDLARTVILSLDVLASEIVDVVLPTVPERGSRIRSASDTQRPN